jgi:glycosyltransferase involved in cell wall biosynthesis
MTGSSFDKNRRISILMPVYQPNPHWLKATIDSLNAQTYRHWQLILSLDGDDPATLAAADIARKTLTTEHKLVVVQGSRSGITGALNRGLTACDSTYTARLDADDLCRATRLEQQWQLLDQHPDLMACGMQIEGIDGQGHRLSTRLHRYPTTPTLTRLVGALFNTPIAHPVLMFRTQQAKDLGGYRPLPCMEDYDLMARLGDLGGLTNLYTVGLDYRVHTSQHSRQVRPKRSHLLAARWRFLQQLIRQQPASIALVGVPMVLFGIGPQGEYALRRVAGRLAAALKR